MRKKRYSTCVLLKWIKARVLRLHGKMANTSVIRMLFESNNIWRIHLFINLCSIAVKELATITLDSVAISVLISMVDFSLDDVA